MISINKNLKIALLSYIALMLSLLLCGLIAFICEKVNFHFFQNNVIGTVSLDILILVGQYIVVKKCNHGKFTLASIGMRWKENILKYLFIGVTIGTLMFISCTLIALITKCIKISDISFPLDKIIGTTFMALFAAVVEEITCRGIILNQLMKFRGKIFALIVSSVMFASAHVEYYGNAYSLVFVITGGMVFGYFYMVTKSLYTSIGMHFALDGYAGITNSIFHYSKVNVDQLDLYSTYTLIVVLTVLFLGLKFYRYKKLKKAS